MKAAAPKAATMSEAERKLRYARSVVVQAYPFFGALLLNQTVVETTRIPTMATNGKVLFFNPQFVLATPPEQLHGVCAHEALHPGFCHHTRRGSRNAKLWNEACDYVINPILLDAKLVLPPKALYRADLRGMNAEAVYAKLEAEKSMPAPPKGDGGGQPSEGEGRSNGAGGPGDPGEAPAQPGDDEGSAGANTGGQGQDGPEQGAQDVGGCGWVADAEEVQGGEEARQEEEAQWKQRMAQAAMHAAGSMPGSLADAVQELLDPRARWEDLLRRYMNTLSQSDYTWRRQNRRFISSGTYLPSMRDETIGRVAFLCDVSASMPAGAAQQGLSEVAAICAEIKPEGLDVVFFDSRVTAAATYEVGEEPDADALIPGGGGTIFNAAYEWLEAQGQEYSVVVFMTDLYPNDPWDTHHVPSCPILWLDYADGDIVPPYGDEVVRMPLEQLR
jgi:predicted metal-dependent peptidase